MKRFTILVFALLMICLNVLAQDPIEPATPIPPPQGYMDSCGGESGALMLEHFGPNCLNPVFWDLPGMPRIGTWFNYIRDDGAASSGMLLGFSWQFHESRYHYYMLRATGNVIFPFSLEVIAPERVQ